MTLEELAIVLQNIENIIWPGPTCLSLNELSRWRETIVAELAGRKTMIAVCEAAVAYCDCAIITPIPGMPSLTDRRHDLWVAVKKWREAMNPPQQWEGHPPGCACDLCGEIQKKEGGEDESKR